MAENNTAITLFWQIRYESCSSGSNCFQEELDIIFSNNSILPVETVTVSEFLFDAATTLIPGGPNDPTFSYANVQVIMFINEYVRTNITSLICTARLSTTNPTTIISSTVNIAVINDNQSSPITTIPSSQPTSESELSSEPPTCHSMEVWVCNSALVVCSQTLSLKLLCFCQLLLLYAIASCCT